MHDESQTSRPADDRGATGQEEAPEWLVDGYNVLQVTLLGGEDRTAWWTRGARDRLVSRASAWPPERGMVWLVFDGPDPAPPPEDGARGPHVVFAPSADDWILQRVERRRSGTTVVATADRRLAARCRRAGARVIAPGEFVGACPRADDGEVATPAADGEQDGIGHEGP